MFNKLEAKIFFTFFIIFTFFSQWNDIWDFNAFFSLTKAIVEENRFQIDTYHNITEVKRFYNGHYYIRSTPGIPFLTAWIYALAKNFIASPFTHEFLIVVFINSALGALSAVMVYKISNFFTRNEKHRLVTTLSYGFTTSIFLYTLGVYKYTPAILFILLAFYLILRERTREEKSFRNFFLAGIFSGIAFIIYALSVFIILPFLLYILLIDKKMLLLFVFGGIIGILIFYCYMYRVFGNFPLDRFIMHFTKFYHTLTGKEYYIPLEMYNKSYAPTVWSPSQVNPLKVMPRLLFYPWNGLFFYYPILFLSLLGIVLMYRERKVEALFILGIFVLMLTFQSTYRWWGDFSFGPRRFLLVIPFLILGLPYILEKLNLKIFLIFFILSLFVNLLGLQFWMSLDSIPRINEIYLEKVEKFQILRVPLIQDYLPNFIKNGPRSLLFENLLFKGRIDIRFGEYNGEYVWKENINSLEKYRINLFYLPFLGEVTLKTPFLCLVPLSLILFGIWYKEIKRRLGKKKIVWMFLILILIFILLFVRLG